MTTFGKSIRIYLKDGTVTGIKVGEIVNQTIQSISCPRHRIPELVSYSESKRPGVYFLFGLDENTGESKAYIGEAENVYDRLQQHIAKKEFWNEVAFFVSKDENLTKAHVKYLESRLIQIAVSTKRYELDNSNQPQLPALPLADCDAMEEFLTYIKLLIGVLGHKFLEDIISIKTKKDEAGQVNTNSISTNNLELFLSVAGIEAKALQTDEGIVVLKGSELKKDCAENNYDYKKLREKLINDGIVKLTGEKYIFQSDKLFSSPTAAAAVIKGRNTSGLTAWKDSYRKTLKEIEEERMKHHEGIEDTTLEKILVNNITQLKKQ
ncbi:GIY-YIG catalytic domain protein [Bacteroidales bacterium Barb4]|nr:GIY-YIG catalytic domain protein [Bacteroidales bacterium Barb4]